MELTTEYQNIDAVIVVQSLAVYIQARYTQQDVANNRSYVQYRCVATMGSYIRDTQGSWSVNGSGAGGNSGSWSYISSYAELGTTEGWVYHDSEGTASVSCSATINAPNWNKAIQQAEAQVYLKLIEQLRLQALMMLQIKQLQVLTFLIQLAIL